ncbi:MAG TPA: preprotein translocase subunit SecE [Clostridia bacterium]|jgi:preprotein translocase SecE subunit|nr:preprotein translocase subunit SecE [Clostridia bacterium]
MAKNDIKLDLPEVVDAPAASNDTSKKKSASKKSSTKRRSIAKYFRDIISELKKVEWAKFKRNKSNSGVIAQTGTVLIVVLFFTIIITAIDLGLTELLTLLLKAA